jgi:hypothetical protein
MAADRDDHDKRTARINAMLEELRLNTEDLHELAKQVTDRSWDVRAQLDSQPTKIRET